MGLLRRRLNRAPSSEAISREDIGDLCYRLDARVAMRTGINFHGINLKLGPKRPTSIFGRDLVKWESTGFERRSITAGPWIRTLDPKV